VGINLGNTIVGSGIIGLPFALKQSGFVLGIFLLLLTAALTVFSLGLLIRAGLKAKKYHYPDLFEHCFGLPGFYIMNLILLFNSSGGCISYLSMLPSSWLSSFMV